MVDQLSGLILARSLGAGRKLPSIREFAAVNGISKSTAVEAYDRLVAQGLLTSRPKAGFYVATLRGPVELRSAIDLSAQRAIDPIWMLRNSLQLDPAMLKPGCGWLPAPLLHSEGIARGLRAVSRAGAQALSGYGEPLGFEPLRRHLQRLLALRGIDAGAGQIMLTDSGSQAIDLALRLLLRPGDTVLVDDPCYFNFQAVLAVHGAKVVSVPLLANGPDMAAFAAAAALHRPRLYLTNGSLHNPTGVTVAPAVAHQLLSLAEQFDFAIVEDDTFADFEERPSTRLAALDQLQRVIHIGSFSKTLSGAARCGYLSCCQEWLERLVELKLATSFGNNEACARLIHQLLVDGSYRKHMDAVRAHLRGASVQARRRIKDCGLTLWHEAEEGLFLWAKASGGTDCAGIARDALEQGILLAPGDVFSPARTAGNYLRFNVAQSSDPRIFDFLRTALQLSAFPVASVRPNALSAS
ncbi:PLP-dependent aminotransferase family protein [Janthinobacterium sp. CG_23.3]|uniref:aminotransferase-like domain-containing protein n=1 Tax=Janthinobacterium sp. CG_23.3 TaxID=3349634 RepID=UPI0038D398F5